MLAQLLFTVAPLALRVVAKPLESRAEATDAMLYAYGANGIGGFPIVNIGGYAYITGNVEDMKNTTVHQATFTSSDGTMVASTNNQTLKLAIPEHGAIQFVADANDFFTMTGFGWYGKMLYVRMDGKMETLWSAQPTEQEHVYQLGWNITDTPALDIRNVAPSHP